MYILKIVKKNLVSILFFLFLIFLVFFLNENLTATKEGLNLWAKNVVPSLLPFFIATELLNTTNITSIFNLIFNRFMRPIFNIPGEGAYAFLMGIISGYPVGAKIVCDLYSSNACTKEEAERMLAFSNNSGPLFIIGTTGILLFGNSEIGILLFITHLLSSVTVGIILGIISRIYDHKEFPIKNTYNLSPRNSDSPALSSLGTILSSSITKAIQTTLQIGGFVIFFSILLEILDNLNIIYYTSNLLKVSTSLETLSNGIITGIIELTNGIKVVANLTSKDISSNIIVCAFLLGFGGFSVLLQVLGIISKYNLSIKIYLFGKLLQGLIASYYTYYFISNFRIFNLNLPGNCVSCFPHILVATLTMLCIILVIKYESRAHN